MFAREARSTVVRLFLCLLTVVAFGCSQDGDPPGGDEAVSDSDPGTQAASTAAELEFLLGTWSGVLEYLDYGDNQTRVELATETTYRRDGDGIAYTTVFTEPNGSKITDEGRLERLDGDRLRVGDDVYDLVDKSADGRTWRLSSRGTDNGQPAELQLTLEQRGNDLVMRKEVLIDGAEETFVRNEIRLTRSSP